MVGAHSPIADPVWHGAGRRLHPERDLWGLVSRAGWRSPHEVRELACDRDSDGGALLRSLGVEVCLASVQPQLCPPRGVDRGGWLALLASLQAQRQAWTAPVVPGCLDEQPACMA